MILRSDTLFAALLPGLAIGWVIADAATGFVAADRAAQTPTPVIHIVGEMEPASFTAPMVVAPQNRTSTIKCSEIGDVEAVSDQAQRHANLLLLCRAGLKFTSRLPNS